LRTDGQMLDEIAKLKRARPFQPFSIVLRSGEARTIEEPDRLAISKSSVHYASPATDRVFHITSDDIVAVNVIAVNPQECRMLETILTLKHRDPFVQFQIVMNSGDRYLIENPDLLAIGKSELAYYFPRSNRVAFLRTNQVAAVEQLEERPAA
jgi:hypothetical protein